jgi:hypothetical protein
MRLCGCLIVALAAAGIAVAADTRLVDAVKAGDRSAATALLQQKVDVNAPEPDGTTALPGLCARTMRRWSINCWLRERK